MKYKRLPGTCLSVSELCLGTMTFGGQATEKEGMEMLHYAVDKGVNFIDTADIYPCGASGEAGDSELAIGKAIAGMRDKVILATKVRFPFGIGLNNSGLSRYHIINSVENSLKRLKTDHIDIYYMHFYDNYTPFDETLRTMDDLVSAGKIRYVGFSNFPAWQMCDALAVSDKRNFIAPVITENVYNVLTRSIETELVPCIKKHKIALTVFNPLCGGLLTGKYNFANGIVPNTRFTEDSDYVSRYWNEDNFKAIAQLEKIASDAGMSLIELSMRWVASHDFVTSVIMGASKLSHLKQNITLLANGPLPEDIMNACDQVWNSLKGNRFYYAGQKEEY
ncbi:MAG: aldo/keto reductase [Phascolarctobacterium sp.]|nr:aldo/keto reductase [Phascolarctobacterium sp.]